MRLLPPRHHDVVDEPEIESASVRDRGAVLPLILVMTVVGSLVVLPMLTYALTITKTNRVLVNKTERIEAARAGLRTALADPTGLYELCGAAGLNVSVDLPSVPLDVPIESECFFVDSATAADPDTLRFGNVTTMSGAGTWSDMAGSWAPGSGSPDPSAWIPEIAAEPEKDKIWVPNLPAHALDPRSSTPFQMDTSDGAAPCQIYFPGSYFDPLTITGPTPTFFVSGVYYFENIVTVSGGADVVVGEGIMPGCTLDQDAAFSAINAPVTHNSTGKGATFVFGDEGRLVVDDSVGSGDRSIVFNQRYTGTNETTVSSSAGVSIMTVNGDASNPTGIASVPGLIEVPMSMTGEDGMELATEQSYVPSEVNLLADPPDTPSITSTTKYDRSVVVRWNEPSNNGGAEITGYEVTASPGGATCWTGGYTACSVDGLDSTVTYDFTVVAVNDAGVSSPSSAASEIPNGAPQLPPDVPTNPATESFDDAVRVSWDEPADGGSPIISYVVSDSSGSHVCTTDRPDATECVVYGVGNGTARVFTVTARNTIGDSLPSSSVSGTGSPSQSAPPGPWATYSNAQPVVDFTLAGTSETTVVIPGYVSVPMGRIKLDNVTGQGVELAGGILAGAIDIRDSRMGTSDFNVGFINAIVQRKFKIVTTAEANGGTNVATAIVQINEGGGWAVNAWEVR